MELAEKKQNDDEQFVIIQFDEGEDITLSKSLLIENSLYFEAMFSGNFVESRSENKLHLKSISRKGLLNVINTVERKYINIRCIDSLLLLLETSQILQFTETTLKTIELIETKWFFTENVLPIFLLVSRLGMEDLYKKAFINILYKFNYILTYKRKYFWRLCEKDLKLLLNHNGLNVENETDVYDLVIRWCKKNENNDEYEIAIECVRFNSMNKVQLEYCISKTNNFNLQNTIKQLMNKSENPLVLIKPPRKVPYVLCAMKNNVVNGYSFVFRWDWDLLKFVEFLRVDPLPQDTFGYHVAIKDFDMYVLAGEIGFGKGMWNESGWKYNFIFKQWKQLKNFTPSKRRHGFAYICGNELYLIGGLTKYRHPNQLMERFKIDNDSLDRDSSYLCDFTKKLDRQIYTCLEYEGHLVMITKELHPMWYQLCSSRESNQSHFSYRYEGIPIPINGVVISATVFHDNVYIFAYDKEYCIALYSYCPEDPEACTTLRQFSAVYDQDSSMCTFNVNTAMVFGSEILECFCLENHTYQSYQHSIELESFHSKFFFSIPIY